MIIPDFETEKKFVKSGYKFIIGIDEVGRGPLAGPVVACAASFKDPRFGIGDLRFSNLIRDSKSLSQKQREKVFDFLKENFYVGVGMCDHKTIDRINILEASFLAMKKAINSLMRVISNNQFPITKQIPNPKSQNIKYKTQDTEYILLIDGNKEIPNLSAEQRAVVNGDKKVKTISAASIVAKITRDRIMLEMDKKYPEFGFGRHKGYGTKFHIEALKINGPCEIHRRSFEPVASLYANR